MRYIVTMRDGERWATDFESGDPIRRPNGNTLYETFLAQRVDGGIRFPQPIGETIQVALAERHAVSIVDTDCG